MWKVAVVQPVTEGFGFNITTETNLPLVSFAYKTRAEAETAATHAQAAVEKAVSVLTLFKPAASEPSGPFYWIGGTDEGDAPGVRRSKKAGREPGQGHQLRGRLRRGPPGREAWTNRGRVLRRLGEQTAGRALWFAPTSGSSAVRP